MRNDVEETLAELKGKCVCSSTHCVCVCEWGAVTMVSLTRMTLLRLLLLAAMLALLLFISSLWLREFPSSMSAMLDQLLSSIYYTSTFTQVQKYHYGFTCTEYLSMF